MNLEQAMSIFEIKEMCSLETLKKIYHNLAKQNHPDLSLTKEEQLQKEIKMQEINSAYDRLKNATEEDFLKLKKRNCKKEFDYFLSNLEELNIEKAQQLQNFLINNDIDSEEMIKFLYRFIKLRKNYYYEKTSSFLFHYYYDEKIFKKEELTYLKLLCETMQKQYLATILFEIDTIVQQAVIRKVSRQKQCLNEYASLDLYPYKEQQKNILIKILHRKIDIETKKKIYLKTSLCFQLEESILRYIGEILCLFKEEERTYARKQLLFAKACAVVENIIDCKIYNDKFQFDDQKKLFEFPFIFSFSNALRKNTNLFFLEIKKVLENNKIFLTEEEIKKYIEKLYQEMLSASREKTIEPPQYILRNKRVSFKYQ